VDERLAVSERFISAVVALAAVGFAVALFLKWIEGRQTEGFSFNEIAGIDISPSFVAFAGAIALVLWELLAILHIGRTTRADSLIAFFLATGTALAGAGTIAHARWTAPYGLPTGGDLAYGAWIAIPLAALLLVGGLAHLAFHVQRRLPAQAGE
jgi:hypothetical protein